MLLLVASAILNTWGGYVAGVGCYNVGEGARGLVALLAHVFVLFKEFGWP